MKVDSYVPVKAVEDDSAHWYIIPNDLHKKFRELHNKICNNEDDQDSIDEFEKLFSEFRTGGDLNNTQLYIKQDVK